MAKVLDESGQLIFGSLQIRGGLNPLRGKGVTSERTISLFEWWLSSEMPLVENHLRISYLNCT